MRSKCWARTTSSSCTRAARTRASTRISTSGSIPALRARYGVPVGYSGHETGIASSVAAVALGACFVERHITTDRSLWGSDQAASLEPNGITRVVRDIRSWRPRWVTA